MAEEAKSAGLPPNGESRARLLLVEDNPGDARLTVEALREAGRDQFEVIQVERLEQAVAELRESRPDVVLLDLSLPDSQGLETFERVREAAPDVVVIVLSGLDDEALATRTVQMGGQDYLVKGDFEGRLLVRAIHHARQRKRLENDLRRVNDDLQRSNEELRATQLQLIQAEKMESLGRLAAGVAHEVKNPLARVLLGSEYLAAGISRGDKNVARVVREIRDSALRADEIIQGMVDFSSARRPHLEKANVNEVIERAIQLVQYQMIRAKVRIVRELAEDLPPVKLDRGKIEQVLVNVFFNALHAMKDSPERRLVVRTSASALTGVDRRAGLRTKNHLRQNDEVVAIEVEDNGCGIPHKDLASVFDPFFTTKSTGEGTGLGLTVVRKIVDLHKGMIALENRDEGGVKVTITLKSAAAMK